MGRKHHSEVEFRILDIELNIHIGTIKQLHGTASPDNLSVICHTNDKQSLGHSLLFFFFMQKVDFYCFGGILSHLVF